MAWRFSFNQLLSIFLSVILGAGPAWAKPASTPQVHIRCPDPSNLSAANPEYVAALSDMLKQLGAKTVNCTSCYRPPEEQRRACVRICGNPNGCPGRCAPPGRSQHQRRNVATCDLSGMPEGSCWTLKKLCDEKYGGKCGIGGYVGGGYHFGVGDYRFSAWNKCGGLPRKPGEGNQYAGDRPGVYTPPSRPDPSEGTGGSELEAQALITKHEAIMLLAIAAAGAGGYLLYQKWQKNKR